MVLMIVQLIYIRNDSYIIDLTLQLRDKVLMAIVASVLAIGLSALLIPRMGIAGMCLGMIIGRLALTISYPLIISKSLGASWKPRPGRSIRPALAMTALFVGSAYFGQSLLVKNWVVWAICSGLTFCMVMGVAMIAGLDTELRAALKKRIFMLRTLLISR